MIVSRHMNAVSCLPCSVSFFSLSLFNFLRLTDNHEVVVIQLSHCYVIPCCPHSCKWLPGWVRPQGVIWETSCSNVAQSGIVAATNHSSSAWSCWTSIFHAIRVEIGLRARVNLWKVALDLYCVSSVITVKSSNDIKVIWVWKTRQGIISLWTFDLCFTCKPIDIFFFLA